MKTSFDATSPSSKSSAAKVAAAASNRGSVTPIPFPKRSRTTGPSVVTPSPSDKDKNVLEFVNSSKLPNADFVALCRLLGLSADRDGSYAVALAKFLADLGISSLEDLAFVEKKDFEEMSNKSTTSLSPILQRKLERLAAFAASSEKSLSEVSSMKEVLVGKSDSGSAFQVLDEELKKDSKIIPPVINLNVGGNSFTTTKETLCRVPGSVLESMFSGRHPTPAHMENGKYIIDRNGELFHYILDFLRMGGVVVQLPQDEEAREALAMEADYYGLDELALACRAPMIDTWECLPEDVKRYREEEDKLRAEIFRNRHGQSSVAGLDLHVGLITLFSPDEGLESLPLTYQPGMSPSTKGVLLLDDINQMKPRAKPGTAVTVKTLSEFRSNFNRAHANILNRLSDILLDEPVIIAGGSVLNGLTSSKEVRTNDLWGKKSDVDLFVHTKDKAEATRIARRIFYSLAADNENWVIIRSRGVITMHSITVGSVDEKIQVVLRLYDSPSEILLGFDCDCCCCAYDGRSVWVTSRWVRSLTTGYNVLNPLHAWPNRASYELRLCKYAKRGFAVFVPGLEKKRINYEMIRNSSLRDVKGLARLLKITHDYESAPSFGLYNIGFSDIPSVRSLQREDKTPEERLIACESGYGDDTDVGQLLIPSCYGEVEEFYWWFPADNFPIARESRDPAWQEIENGGENANVPENVPQKLMDAWELHKRSREFLNSQTDKHELDNIYYSYAFEKLS